MSRKKDLQLRELALQIRLALMDEIMHLGFGHLSGSLSIVDALAVLYGEKMQVRYQQPDWPERDYLVVSKGHAGPAVYATLALKGFFPRSWLHTLNMGGSNLPSHCDRTKTPGVDMTAGSLGQGICAACGIALGLKRSGSKQKVFCIVGDGELDEGSCWEAIMFAAAHQLNNFYLIIDENNKQLDGDTKDILKHLDLAVQMRDFGFNVKNLPDGNNATAISDSITEIENDNLHGNTKPNCLVLHTIKGKGYKALEEMKLNHHIQVKQEEAQAAYEHLAEELHAVQSELQQYRTEADEVKGVVAESEANSEEFCRSYLAGIQANMYETGVSAAEPEFSVVYDGTDHVPNKDNFLSVLRQMRQDDPKIMYLDADLINSSGAYKFWQEHPENVVECGICEANMIGVAAGLSLVGYKPYCHTFGPFASRRCYDHAFISVAYAGNSVRIFGSDEGVCAAYNGGTHMPFEDLALYRAVPHATVLDISDEVLFKQALLQIKDRKGLTYFRSTRKSFKRIYNDEAKFVIGKANILHTGKDVTLIACGLMVGEAYAAMQMLEKEGYSVGVIDMWTLKPLDVKAILHAASTSNAIMTVENHNVIGGLGDAVAACLAENSCAVRFKKYGVNDEFGQVGTQAWLQKAYKLTAEDIVAYVKKHFLG